MVGASACKVQRQTGMRAEPHQPPPHTHTQPLPMTRSRAALRRRDTLAVNARWAAASQISNLARRPKNRTPTNAPGEGWILEREREGRRPRGVCRSGTQSPSQGWSDTSPTQGWTDVSPSQAKSKGEGTSVSLKEWYPKPSTMSENRVPSISSVYVCCSNVTSSARQRSSYPCACGESLAASNHRQAQATKMPASSLWSFQRCFRVWSEPGDLPTDHPHACTHMHALSCQCTPE